MTSESSAGPDIEAIRRLVDDAQANQFEVEQFLELHTDDITVVNFGGRRVMGKQALRDAMQSALASPLAKVTTSAEVHDIRFVRPDVAVVSATKHVTDERDDGERFASEGAMTYVVVRGADGAWRISLAQTTPIRTG